MPGRTGRRTPSARPSAAFFATASRIGAGHTSSTSPALRARGAFSARPVRMRSSEVARPTRRGRRCVPPAPGTRPSITSGSPIDVFGSSEATRYRHARASSVPPPRQVPWIAATTGTRQPSSRSKIAWPARESASPSSAEPMRVKSLMSAPAMKLSGLPLRTTIARTDASSSTSESSRSNSAIRPLPSVLSFSPGTSRVSTRTPSSPFSRVKALASLTLIAPGPSRSPCPPARRPRGARTSRSGASSRWRGWS